MNHSLGSSSPLLIRVKEQGVPTVEPLHLELRKLMLSGRESDGVSPKLKG